MRGTIWWHHVLFLVFIFFHFQVVCSSFFSTYPPDSAKSCSGKQSIALLKFRKSFSISPYPSCFGIGYRSYPKAESWNESTDCCSWDGVTCDKLTGHVIGLDLSCSLLSGTFPANSSLFLLTHLQWLNLAYNDFVSSPIPSEFGELVNLSHLNLSRSKFSSIVPSQISHMSKLVSLDLSFNFLNLDQPTFNMLAHNLTNLRDVRLDDVLMSSVVPSSLLNLSSTLISLGLSATELQGNLPDDVFRFPHLQDLVLNRNENLSGDLPKSNWSNPLRFLDLTSMSFSGELPDSIGNLKDLQNLQLSSCNFIGSISISLANLTQLTHLDLSWNGLAGQIPDVFGNINQLTFLDLSGNRFSGPLPASAFNLTRISELDLSLNQLVGHLPYQVSGLSNLTKLSLDGNLLDGRVPSWLFSLPSLNKIGLSYNKFTGFTDQFQSPNSVQSVALRWNKIHGTIPSYIFELENLAYLDISSNNLSGIVEFDKFSKMRNLEMVDLSYNSLLSLGSSSNDGNFSLDIFSAIIFSSCNIREFPYFLRNLRSLAILDLSKNKIHGQISKLESEGWENLQSLDLSNNFLTGIEQLPGRNLENINLRSNLIGGSLPAPPSSTKVFLISDNNITGAIPSTICKLSSLRILDLSNNRLNGTIPKCLGNVSNVLSVFDLHMNQFHGIIPITFVNGSKLRNLNLNGNLLDGPLPQSLVNCSNLEVLDLGNNRLKDVFPYWLGTLPKLQVLVLRSNRFHGIMSNPESLLPFPMLRIIDLSYNKFSGILPTIYFESLKAMIKEDKNKIDTGYMGEDYYQDSVIVSMKGGYFELERILNIFTTIDFSSNHFNGHIPEVIGVLTSLLVLNFSHNSLTGDIPLSLGNLTALESLDLSSNKFVGRIPAKLTDLTFLAVLNLSQNQLVGSIPRGKQFNTFQNDSYSGNLGLCGYPLSEKCGIDEALQPPPPSIGYEEDDYVGVFDWKFAMMGYGCGIVFGFSMAYIVFATGKPWWFVNMIERQRYKMVRRANQRRGGRK